jgi:hypothetical protein
MKMQSLVIAFALSGAAAVPCEARPPIIVTTAIVFAVDTSSSVTPEEKAAQSSAHAAALRSPHFAKQVLKDKECAAINYFEWSSVGDQRSVLPWTLLCSANDIERAARIIEDSGSEPRGRKARLRTSLSFAVDLAAKKLDDLPFNARRKVIGISTDGTNNDGTPVADSRDRAVAKGYTINAIGLSHAEPGVTDSLKSYLRQNVIGGDDAFALAAETLDQYPDLLLGKLLIEINGQHRRPVNKG